MKRLLLALLLTAIVLTLCAPALSAREPLITLGNEVLFERYYHLIEGKKVGLVTNQSGINSRGVSTIEILDSDPHVDLVALYGPEHGIDGKAAAGEYVESYTDPELQIPVYSLYGPTRMPTAAMLQDIDVLLYDIQDIGARSYTYISTLHYCMQAGEKYNTPIVVLDRPNPLGGLTVEGPMMEERFRTFVGVDILPKAHGMTVGELAFYFNRDIGVDLTVVPMEGYKRSMIYQDTGLPWIETSPNIPDLDSVFGYMATGLGEGTGVRQADKFKWIGGEGLNSLTFARALNGAGLPGVSFIPETKGAQGGARLQITNYYTFNPARTGIYALSYAFSLGDFQVPKSGDRQEDIVMFDKIMGSDLVGNCLEQGLTPQQIESRYAPALERFKRERENYLLSRYNPRLDIVVDGELITFDNPPYIDAQDRMMVPLRAVAEAMGGEADWEPDSRTAIIMKERTELRFPIGDNKVLVNGEEKTMDTVSVIVQDRTMIPLRFAGEFLGAEVDWNHYTRTAFIKSK